MVEIAEHGEPASVPESCGDAQVIVADALGHNDQLGVGGADLENEKTVEKIGKNTKKFSYREIIKPINLNYKISVM